MSDLTLELTTLALLIGIGLGAMIRSGWRAAAIADQIRTLDDRLQSQHRDLEARVVRTEAALLHVPKREDLDHLRAEVHDVGQRVGRIEAQSQTTLQTVQLISQHLMGVKP